MAAMNARFILGLLLLGIALSTLSVEAQPGVTYMPNTGFVEPPPAEPGPSYMQRRLIRRPLVLPRQGPLCYVERIEARDAAEGVLVAGGTAGDGGAKISAKETAFLETRSTKLDSHRGAPAPSAAASHPAHSFAETEAHSSLSMRASSFLRRRQQQQSRSTSAAHAHAEGDGGDVGSASGMIQHVCKYSGVDDVTDGDGKTRGVLRYPENIEFKRVASHYFSCCDPRSKYAVLGTLGGDIGEFINALAVMEKLQKRPYNEAEVNTLFQQFLKVMAKRGRLYFYMHTDEEAMKALADAAQAKDPRRPASPQERNRLLKAAIQPDNVGCQHLKGLLSEPDGYGVRKQITEWVMQAYLSIYYDDANPLRTLLLYTVSPGKLEKAKGTARIWSPDECPGIAPLIVPNTGTTQAAVVHQAHAAYFRQDLARFLSFQNAFIEVKAIYNELQQLAAKQVAEKMSAYADGKTVEVIFTSAWDRWPF